MIFVLALLSLTTRAESTMGGYTQKELGYMLEGSENWWSYSWYNDVSTCEDGVGCCCDYGTGPVTEGFMRFIRPCGTPVCTRDLKLCNDGQQAMRDAQCRWMPCLDENGERECEQSCAGMVADASSRDKYCALDQCKACDECAEPACPNDCADMVADASSRDKYCALDQCKPCDECAEPLCPKECASMMEDARDKYCALDQCKSCEECSEPVCPNECEI